MKTTHLILAAVTLLAATLFAHTARAASPGWVPPDDTIVKIEGDAANGFGIYYYDGSSIFPPTRSEVRAECSEYDTPLDRVRCRVEMRIWYRDLADTRRAMRYARITAGS